MQLRIIYLCVSSLLFLGFGISACATDLKVDSALNPSVSTAATSTKTITASASKVPTQLILTPTQSSNPTQPGIADQFQQALQTARTRLEQSLQGPALQKEEQGLQTWAETNQNEIEYEKNNGTVATNANGDLVFTGQSAVWFANLLAGLEVQIDSAIKWSNYQERTPQQRQAAMDAIQAYAGLPASYLSTEVWIYDPLIMVEDYQASGYVYKVNVENEKIVEIDPVSDGAFASSGILEGGAESYRKKAEEIIGRLAPNVELDRLTYAENVSPGYYRWEDRLVGRQPSGQYRSLQVVFAPDGQFFSYLNSLY